jgi:hypothetical protein
MNRDDRLVRNVLIGLALLEALVIGVFVATKLHLIGS